MLVRMERVYDNKPIVKKKLPETSIGTVKRLGGAQQVEPIPNSITSKVFPVPLLKQSTFKLPLGKSISKSLSLVALLFHKLTRIVQKPLELNLETSSASHIQQMRTTKNQRHFSSREVRWYVFLFKVP